MKILTGADGFERFTIPKFPPGPLGQFLKTLKMSGSHWTKQWVEPMESGRMQPDLGCQGPASPRASHSWA